MKKSIALCVMFLLFCGSAMCGPRDNPRATKDDLFGSYLGSFKITANEGGYNSVGYQHGMIAVNAGGTRLITDSHPYAKKIVEVGIPATLGSGATSGLPTATITQSFVSVMDRADTADPGWTNTYSAAIINGQLFIQGALFYDNTPVSETTLVIRDSTNISGNVDGYFNMEGTGRTINWISPIPSEWQVLLNGTHIAGNGLGQSVIGRLSKGPSLYTFNAADFDGVTSGAIDTNAFLSYPTGHELSTSTKSYPAGTWDEYNNQGYDSGFVTNNDLWTQLSRAWYGFIIPGTRTYAVIGVLGCLTSGGGYKITQSDGNVCGGPCTRHVDDTYAYYWLYDMNDILDATNTYDPLPYEYGIWDHKYERGRNEDSLPRGASYDPTTGKLYILLQGAIYDGEPKPVVSVYQIGDGGPRMKSGKLRIGGSLSKLSTE